MENLLQFGAHPIIAIDLVFLFLFLFLFYFEENLASILELDDSLNENFNIFKEAPENERKRELFEEHSSDPFFL
jgi:hypothetical protein